MEAEPDLGIALESPAHDQPDRVHVRHRPVRTKVTKGPGSRAAGIAMAYKLIDAAQARWRAVNAPHLVALVRGGAVFRKLLERPTDITPEPSTTRVEIGGTEVA